MRNIPKLEKVILDSVPLLLVLTINYTIKKNLQDKESFIKKVYHKLDIFPNPVYTLMEFFNGISLIYTTPHVIGEVIGLVKTRLKLKNNESEFWNISLEYLKRKNISEELISIIDLTNDIEIYQLVKSIGFVDSELIKYSIESKLPIISIDGRTLKYEAKKKKVEVLVLEDDIYPYIDLN